MDESKNQTHEVTIAMKLQLYLIMFLLLLASASAINETEAYTFILEGQEIIDEAIRAELPTSYLEDLLFQAQQQFDGENKTKIEERARKLMDTDPDTAMSILEQLAASQNDKIGENYSAVKELVEDMREKKDTALGLLDDLELLYLSIQDVNITANVTIAMNTYRTAQGEFTNERYDRVSDLIDQAYVEMDDAIIEASWLNAKISSSKRTFLNYVKNHLGRLIVVVIVIIALIFIGIQEIIFRKNRKKLESYDLEERLLHNLKLKAEKEYYQHKTTSKKIFEIKYEKYKDRELQIKKDRPIINSALEKQKRILRWKK